MHSGVPFQMVFPPSRIPAVTLLAPKCLRRNGACIRVNGFSMPAQIFRSCEALTTAYDVTERSLMGFLVASVGFEISLLDRK